MERQPNPPTAKGPAAWFTGDVWIDPIAQGPSFAVNAVHFSPGAHTAWHSHGGTGQTLYVTAGEGHVQSRGEPVVTIRPGDIVRTPAGEEHWHGATHDHFMTHLSITDGAPSWGDHLTAEEYGDATSS